MNQYIQKIAEYIGCSGFHDWESMPVTKGLAKRGVIEYRKCRKCHRGQIRKSIYKSLFNHGWRFNGELGDNCERR